MRAWVGKIDRLKFRTRCRVLGLNPLTTLLDEASKTLKYSEYALVRKHVLTRISNGDNVLAEIIKADVEADRRKYDARSD